VKSEKHLFLGFSQIRGNPQSTGEPRITPDKAQSNLVKPSHTGQSRNKAPERWLTTDFTDGTDKK
jgi:hypothetical protein